MKGVKIFILFSILFLSYNFALSQNIYKLRAKYYCYKTYNYYYGWSEWSDWEYVNILIVIDTFDERITIYAKETNHLDIYDYDIKYEYDKTVLYFWCIDNDGIRCRVRFVLYKDKDEYNQIYIDYAFFIIAYSIKPMFN
ncbi:MAG: hypothetical protein N2490_05690 [Ignavibacteria bacterium]|nr:hypothetical protein [Ignavibacteria bacterium]